MALFRISHCCAYMNIFSISHAKRHTREQCKNNVLCTQLSSQSCSVFIFLWEAKRDKWETNADEPFGARSEQNSCTVLYWLEVNHSIGYPRRLICRDQLTFSSTNAGIITDWRILHVTTIKSRDIDKPGPHELCLPQLAHIQYEETVAF